MKTCKGLRKNVNAANLDELVFELRCSVDMLQAVQTAMADGPNPADCYTDALFGVILCFQNLTEKISDEIYEEAAV